MRWFFLVWTCLVLSHGVGAPGWAATYPLSGFYPLQQSTARGVYQDAQGCIWLATDLGLWRWANDHFVTVGERFQTINPSGCFLEAGSNLWIGTDTGIAGIDLARLSYQEGPPQLAGTQVHDLLADNAGRVWCAAQDGLYILDLGASPPSARRLEATTGRPQYCLANDSKGRLWVGTDRALDAYDSADGSPRIHYSLNEGQVRALMCASDQSLWIGMRDRGGLYRLAEERWSKWGPADGLLDEEVNAIIQHPGGEVWVGTQMGVFRWSNGQFTTIDRTTGLACEQVNDIFMDREDLVWIATQGGGAYLLRSPYVFTYDVYDDLPHSEILAILPSGDDQFLIGTPRGLCRMSASGTITQRFEYRDSVTALYADDQGRYWAGGPGGLSCFYASTGEPASFHCSEPLRDVTGIGPAPGSGVLICAAGDLWSLQDDSSTRVSLSSGPEDRDPTAQDLFWGPEMGLYVATEDRLLKWSEPCWDTLLSGRPARSMTRDSKRRLWIGTTQGLIKEDNNGIFGDVFGRGFRDTDIRDVAVDQQGIVWLATPDGLTRYDGTSFATFARGDGLPAKEVHCVQALKDGLMLVGTAQGLSFVASNRFAPSKAAPRVSIVTFLAGGEQYDPTSGPVSVPNTHRNVISFTFQGIGFREEGKGLRYKSRLIGFDEDWSPPGEEPKRDYTNLRWGHYQFEVKAVNAHGMQSLAAATVAFDIEPPFWMEPWFMAAAIIALSAASAWVLAIQRRKRQLQKAAEAANIAKSQFLANVSHEIRTPITAILGCTEMLADGHGTRLSLPDGIDTIRRNSNHLLGMINDLLDLSKTEAGHLEVELTPSLLHEILSDVDALMRNNAQRRGLELRIVYETEVPDRILTDPTRLRQTLINLIGNAIKFTSRGRVSVRVRVETRDTVRWLVFDVEDTGIGIPVEKIGTIFDAFTQAEASTSRKYGGTGLGLAIAESLAEKLYGKLSVRSTVGKGSTFTLAIDLSKAGLEQAGMTSRWVAADDHSRFTAVPTRTRRRRDGESPPARLRGHILLAEDAPDIRGIMRLLLESAGVRVTTADNGPDAVEAAYDGRFDAVIMDIHMPGMDGIAAVKEIRDRGVETPIIVISADSSEDRQAECRAAGVQGFIPKPFQRKEFLDEMAKHLETVRPAESPAYNGPIFSELDVGSPRMAAAVAEFVRALEERVAQMESAALRQDFKTIAHLAHQLRGAGGINGYMCVTDKARQIEESLVKGDASAIGAPLRELEQLKRRIVAGLQAQITSPALNTGPSEQHSA